MFTSQNAAVFYDKLFQTPAFELPHANTGRRGFPKEAVLCAVPAMKCERLSRVKDYLDNNRIIAHCCGFGITKKFPSYWT